MYCNVLLPLPLPGSFSYEIPQELSVDAGLGKRVVVQFGPKKVYSGIITRIFEETPVKPLKPVLSVLDRNPVVNTIQISFWQWISDYYMCYPGEVMNVALPSVLKLSSETKLILNQDLSIDYETLSEYEYLVTEALELQKILTLKEISDIVGFKKVVPLIKNLIEKEVAYLFEEIHEKYSPKTESFIKLSDEYLNEEGLNGLLDKLDTRARKQYELLINYLMLAKPFSKSPLEISKKVFLEQFPDSAGALKALTDKKVMLAYQKRISRFESHENLENPEDIALSAFQSEAFRDIQKNFEEHEVVLLHGVTSSGKTEIYIKLIQDVILKGKQVLYLLPEIALTSQIIYRLRRYFGDKVGVYHSKFNEQERAEIWNRLAGTDSEREDGPEKLQIILGARSALFLPMNNLGMVIIDEEHDSSFKQFDPAPRYLARDAAIYLARLHEAKVLLGSATPSIESYSNAVTGKYGLVTITERYGGVELPEILIANLKKETREKSMRSHFSSLLIGEMEQALARNEQVILFQNRRGYSLRIECLQCNHIPHCKNCDVSMIYHKHNHMLRCHYCGWQQTVPSECPECHSNAMMMRGFGTEKVEDDLKIILPDAIIGRMDLDTTRSKNAYHRIISMFEDQKINILIGTQMVTKGFDFNNVSVVGILNADNLLSYPDFRAFERAWQLMAQVSGRAGRKNKRGKVIIQTYNPSHLAIELVVANNYIGMFNHEIEERKKFHYPPYVRLIELTLQHKNQLLIDKAANHLGTLLRKNFGKLVYGPEYPVVSKIKNLYLKAIMIKLPKSAHLPDQKNLIRNLISEFHSLYEFKQVRVIIDVDPA